VEERVGHESFASTVAPHLDAMWLLARRLGGSEAEDLVQEALELAWRKRHLYDETRGSMRSWLLALVADRCRRRHRRLRRTEQLSDTAAPAADMELTVDIGSAVRALSPRQRLAIELHYVLGLSVAETAEVMRCSPGTVKSTLSDARGRLRTYLEVTA
jgi:RNA polymerase sigma factor (sigma-70 family)